MRVARAGVSDVRALPEVLHDLPAREHLPGPVDEQQEDAELRRRQLDLHAVDVDAMLVEVDADPSGLADRAGRMALHMRRARIHEEQLQDPTAAFEELLKAFAWMPDSDEVRKALYELAERTGQWNDEVAAESALLERASTPRARLVVLRRKAGVLEDRLNEPVRAFRHFRRSFFLRPETRPDFGFQPHDDVGDALFCQGFQIVAVDGAGLEKSGKQNLEQITAKRSDGALRREVGAIQMIDAADGLV